MKIQRHDHKIVNKYTKTILWPKVIAHPLINFGSQVFGPIYFGGLSWPINGLIFISEDQTFHFWILRIKILPTRYTTACVSQGISVWALLLTNGLLVVKLKWSRRKCCGHYHILINRCIRSRNLVIHFSIPSFVNVTQLKE